MRSPARGFKSALFLSLAAAALAAATSFAGPILDSIEKTVVYNYEGDVTFTRNGKTLPVGLDTHCLKGDVYRTGSGSSDTMDIAILGVMGVRLLSGTELKIVTVQKTLIHFAMASGDVLIKTIEKLPDGTELRIDTPNSTVVVTDNGTQFWASVRSGPNGTGSFFASRKGRISVTINKSSASVSVLEGLALDVPADTYIPNARNATEEEFKRMRQCNQLPIITPENS